MTEGDKTKCLGRGKGRVYPPMNESDAKLLKVGMDGNKRKERKEAEGQGGEREREQRNREGS